MKTPIQNFHDIVVGKLALNEIEENRLKLWLERHGAITSNPFADGILLAFFVEAFAFIIKITDKSLSEEMINIILDDWVKAQKGTGLSVHGGSLINELSTLPDHSILIHAVASSCGASVHTEHSKHPLAKTLWDALVHEFPLANTHEFVYWWDFNIKVIEDAISGQFLLLMMAKIREIDPDFDLFLMDDVFVTWINLAQMGSEEGAMVYRNGDRYEASCYSDEFIEEMKMFAMS